MAVRLRLRPRALAVVAGVVGLLGVGGAACDPPTRDADAGVEDAVEGACPDAVPLRGVGRGGVDERCGPDPDPCDDGLACLAGLCRARCGEELGGCPGGLTCFRAAGSVDVASAGVCADDDCGACDVACTTFQFCGVQCRPPACEGQPCLQLFDDDLNRGGEGEGEGEADGSESVCALRSRPCAAGLTCRTDVAGAATYTCRPLGERGDPCAGDVRFGESPCADGLVCNDDEVCDFPCGCAPPQICTPSGDGCTVPGGVDAPCEPGIDTCNDENFCLGLDSLTGVCRPRLCGDGFPPCFNDGPCVVGAEATLVCGCSEDAHCEDPDQVCRRRTVITSPSSTGEGECAAPAALGELCFAHEPGDPFDEQFDVTCAEGLECAAQALTGDSVERRCAEPQGVDADCVVLPLASDGCLDGLRCRAGDQPPQRAAAAPGACVADIGRRGEFCEVDSECAGESCRDLQCREDQCASDADCPNQTCGDVQCERVCIDKGAPGPCWIDGESDCANRFVSCGEGEECSRFAAPGVFVCAPVAGAGAPCNRFVAANAHGDANEDGCAEGLVCGADGRCQ